MKIEFHSDERKAVEALELPIGTTFIEFRDPDHEGGFPQYLAWYEINEDGKMVMTADLVEKYRRATDEDRAIFKDFTKEQLLEWWAVTYLPDETPYWQHECADELWWGNFRHLRHMGYYPETRQTSFSVCLFRDEPIEPQLEEIQMVMSLIKEVTLIKYSDDKQEAKGKHLGIFEKTCSEFGVYELQVFEDVAELIKTTYGRTELLRTFDSFEEVIKYIAHFHYYQQKLDGNDDDEDEDSLY